MRINKIEFFSIHSIKLITLAGLVVLALGSLGKGVKDGLSEGRSQDFQWWGSKYLLEQKDPYNAVLKTPDAEQPPYILSQAPNYPATGLFFLWPYAAMDFADAKILWIITNLSCLFLLFLSFKILFFQGKSWVPLGIAFLLLLISAPFRNLLSNGQHALFTVASFMWAIYFLKSNKYLSSILLAISWLKYSITFPLSLYFIKKREWKVLVLATAIHLSVYGFLLFWVENSDPISILFGPIYVALKIVNAGYLNISAVMAWLELGRVYTLIFTFITVVLTALCLMKYPISNRESELRLLSVLAFFSLIIMFHSQYDYILLVFPLAVVLSERIEHFYQKLLLLAIAVVWYLDKIPYLIWKYSDSLDKNIQYYYAVPYYYGILAFVFYMAFFFVLFGLVSKRSQDSASA